MRGPRFQRPDFVPDPAHVREQVADVGRRALPKVLYGGSMGLNIVIFFVILGSILTSGLCIWGWASYNIFQKHGDQWWLLGILGFIAYVWVCYRFLKKKRQRLDAGAEQRKLQREALLRRPPDAM